MSPEFVQAWEQSTSFEMMTTAGNGSFSAAGGALVWVLIVGVAALVGFSLIVLFFVLRKKSAASATAVAPPQVALPPPVPQPVGAPYPAHAPQQPALQFLSGERAGQLVILSQCLRVGRAADNDLCLDDALVSGHHAEVTYDNGHWYLKDLASTNGTFLNGRRVGGMAGLNDGDTIGFGDRMLQVCGLNGP